MDQAPLSPRSKSHLPRATKRSAQPPLRLSAGSWLKARRGRAKKPTGDRHCQLRPQFHKDRHLRRGTLRKLEGIGLALGCCTCSSVDYCVAENTVAIVIYQQLAVSQAANETLKAPPASCGLPQEHRQNINKCVFVRG